MFGLGASELLLIAVAALVLMAMGKLPDVARKAGGAYRTYRKVENDVRTYTDPTKIIDVIASDPDADRREATKADTDKS